MKKLLTLVAITMLAIAPAFAEPSQARIDAFNKQVARTASVLETEMDKLNTTIDVLTEEDITAITTKWTEEQNTAIMTGFDALEAAYTYLNFFVHSDDVPAALQ